MKIIPPIVAGVLMLVIGIPLYFYTDRSRRFKKPFRLVIKSSITAIGGLLALLGAIASGSLFAYFAAAPLFSCAVADSLLEYKFFAGGTLFSAGHILYVISFILRCEPSYLSVPVFCAGAIVLCLLFYNMRPLGNLKLFAPIYGTVIVTMVAFAVPLAFYSPPYGVLAAAGSLLFFVSDLIIALNMRFGGSRLSRRTVMLTYYPAQYLLALSAFLPAI